MASLLSKVRLAALANAHVLLDKIIDLNSPAAVAEYIREAEDTLRDMRGGVAEQEGLKADQEQTITACTSRIAVLDREINLLLTNENKEDDLQVPTLVKERAAKVAEAADAKTLLDQATADAADLRSAVDRLQAEHDKMVGQLGQLTARDTAAKAKENAVKDVQRGRDALGAIDGAGVSVDNLAKKIQHRANVANAAFDDVMKDISASSSAEDAVADAEAAEFIKQRRLELAQAHADSVTDADVPAPATA